MFWMGVRPQNFPSAASSDNGVHNVLAKNMDDTRHGRKFVERSKQSAQM